MARSLRAEECVFRHFFELILKVTVALELVNATGKSTDSL